MGIRSLNLMHFFFARVFTQQVFTGMSMEVSN